FRLRRGLKFHNGDAVTAEDVKFSFERYKGAAAKELQSRVEAIEVVNPLTVKFRLKAPWPDFMTFYGTTVSGAGLVVPKKYITQVGDEGFRKHPIGAGPFKFVSHTPRVMDFALQTPAASYDPEKAKKLLAEAGYPNGFDAGDFVPMPPFMTTGEACVNFLAAVGIRTRIRPTERAAFLTNWREKKLRGIFMPAVGNSGNAASRVGEFIYSKGTYAYGGYP